MTDKPSIDLNPADHPGANLFALLRQAGLTADDAHNLIYAYAAMVLRMEKAQNGDRQPETEAYPVKTEWTLETLSRATGKWFRSWPARATRDEAVQDYERDYRRSVGHAPDRRYRIVRVTTTTAVEPTTAVAEEPQP